MSDPARRTTDPVRFSNAEAAAIVGATLDRLDAWRSLAPSPDARASTGFTLADLLGFAVMQHVADRQGADLEAFAAGLARLFQILDRAPDVTRLDGLIALIGPQTAELLPRHSRRLNSPAGYIVAPLGPLLADLRDQVFS